MFSTPIRERRNDTLREVVLSRRHETGLRVYYCPRPGFQKRYCCFATDFGSTDTRFRTNQDWSSVPDGIAHFLEHLMFKQANGVDAMDQFSARGASSNAYTSFDTTNYLYSCSDQFYENLHTLVDFVQSPFFTDENVAKEKDIIGEEIGRADDSPGRQLYFNMLEALYHEHPIQKRILGTRDTIATITPNSLLDCHKTFYHPGNMILFAIGDLDADEYFSFVDKELSERGYEAFLPIERGTVSEPTSVATKQREDRMEISLPRVCIGFKDRDIGYSGRPMLVREQVTGILLEILFGHASPLFESLYEAELVDEGFSAMYSASIDCGYSVIAGETPDPNALETRIREEIARVRRVGIDRDDFERQKRATMGHVFRQFNSLEHIANHFCSYEFADIDLFDLIDVLHGIEFEQVEARLHDHLSEDSVALSVLRPNSDDSSVEMGAQ